MINAFWQRFKIVITVCGAMALVHVANMALGGQLNQFGILPRDPDSWLYIYSSPWLHGNLSHLINNLIGLAIFSWLCLLRTVRLYVWSSLFIITLTGILVWLFGRHAMHIGASGWVFGLWSLSIALACFDRRPLNILIAIAVVFLYGGMIYGVLPQDASVSYEAHLFGTISGVLAAWLSTWKVFK